MTKPSLVVSIPLVWSIRNVLRSGLAARLAEDFHLLYAAPAEAVESLEVEGIPRTDIWILETGSARRHHEWVGRTLRSAHQWRRPTVSDPVFATWYRRKRGVRSLVTDAVFHGAGLLASQDALFTQLESLERLSFGSRVPAEQLDQLRKRQPVAGLSTSCVVGTERGVFHMLQRLGIPTVAHVLSFDNLTSRGFLPIKGFSRYLVWSERMRRELGEFFDIRPEMVEITGTPQFDFHLDPRLWLDRRQTATVLSINPERPYALYCANHWALTPAEPALVAELISRLATHERTRNLEWVVRLHPMDRYDRWEDLRQRFPRVQISHPWPQLTQQVRWGCPSSEEIALLGNSIRHAAVVLTVASTTVLDAAVVGTPAICIGFHPDGPPEEGAFYHDVHFTHHFRPVVESGAAPLARTYDELIELVVQALEDRGGRRAARDRLVTNLCGPVDGKAAERIARAVLSVVRGHEPERSGRRPDHVSAYR